MRCAALLLVLMPSCAMMQAAAKPASVGASAALGAMIGGPAGGAVAAGGTAAAWDVADAEEEATDAKDRLDAIVLAAIADEVGSQVGGKSSALQAKLAEEIDLRTGENKSWLASLLKWALIGYIIKQVLFSKRTPAILGWFRQRLRSPTDAAI